MVPVRIGDNVFHGCLNLIAIKGKPLLRVLSDPLRISMFLERSGKTLLNIDENVDKNNERRNKLRITVRETIVTVRWYDFPIAMAIQNDSDEEEPHPVIDVRLDLRPLGVMLFDDHEGLHVGTNRFANNQFENCTIGIGIT